MSKLSSKEIGEIASELIQSIADAGDAKPKLTEAFLADLIKSYYDEYDNDDIAALKKELVEAYGFANEAKTLTLPKNILTKVLADIEKLEGGQYQFGNKEFQWGKDGDKYRTRMLLPGGKYSYMHNGLTKDELLKIVNGGVIEEAARPIREASTFQKTITDPNPGLVNSIKKLPNTDKDANGNIFVYDFEDGKPIHIASLLKIKNGWQVVSDMEKVPLVRKIHALATEVESAKNEAKSTNSLTFAQGSRKGSSDPFWPSVDVKGTLNGESGKIRCINQGMAGDWYAEFSYDKLTNGGMGRSSRVSLNQVKVADQKQAAVIAKQFSGIYRGSNESVNDEDKNASATEIAKRRMRDTDKVLAGKNQIEKSKAIRDLGANPGELMGAEGKRTRKALNEAAMKPAKWDEEEDAAISEFFKEKSRLAQSIKGMPINPTTEAILGKLHQMVANDIALTEDSVFNTLSEKEKDYLQALNEAVSQVESRIDPLIEQYLTFAKQHYADSVRIDDSADAFFFTVGSKEYEVYADGANNAMVCGGKADKRLMTLHDLKEYIGFDAALPSESDAKMNESGPAQSLWKNLKKMIVNESEEGGDEAAFMKVFDEYVTKRKLEDDIKNRMLELIQEIKDSDPEGYLYWVKNGKTLKLKELLEKTTYRGNGNTPEKLLDFNSFATLDTIGHYYRNGFEINENAEERERNMTQYTQMYHAICDAIDGMGSRYQHEVIKMVLNKDANYTKLDSYISAVAKAIEADPSKFEEVYKKFPEIGEAVKEETTNEAKSDDEVKDSFESSQDGDGDTIYHVPVQKEIKSIPELIELAKTDERLDDLLHAISHGEGVSPYIEGKEEGEQPKWVFWASDIFDHMDEDYQGDFADDKKNIITEDALVNAIFNMKHKQRKMLLDETLKIDPKERLLARCKMAAKTLVSKPKEFAEALKTTLPAIYKTVYMQEDGTKFPPICDVNEADGELVTSPLYDMLKKGKKLRGLKIRKEFTDDGQPCMNCVAVVGGKNHRFSDHHIEQSMVKKYHQAEGGDKDALMTVQRRLTRYGNEFVRGHKALQKEIHEANLIKEAEEKKVIGSQQIKDLREKYLKLAKGIVDKKDLKKLDKEMRADAKKIAKEHDVTIEEAIFDLESGLNDNNGLPFKQSIQEGTWAEEGGPTQIKKYVMYLGEKEGELYILKNDDDSYNVYHAKNESGKEDYLVDKNIFDLDKAMDAAADYAENHLGIDINGGVDEARKPAKVVAGLLGEDEEQWESVKDGDGFGAADGSIVNDSYSSTHAFIYNSDKHLLSIMSATDNGVAQMDVPDVDVDMVNDIMATVKDKNWEDTKDSITYYHDIITENVYEDAKDDSDMELVSKLRDVCFEFTHQQINQDEAVERINTLVKDNDELKEAFKDISPESLPDAVISHFGWTTQDLSEGKTIPEKANLLKKLCVDYYKGKINEFEAIDQARKLITEATYGSLYDKSMITRDDMLLYTIAEHHGWNIVDLVEAE